MFQSQGKEPLTEQTGWPAVCRYCFHKILIEQSSIVAQFAVVSKASLREETGLACYFHVHSSRGSGNYMSHVRPQRRAQCQSFDLHKFQPFAFLNSIEIHRVLFVYVLRPPCLYV